MNQFPKHFDTLRTGDVPMHLYYHIAHGYRDDNDQLYASGCIDATDAIPAGYTRKASEIIGNRTASAATLRG